jgi:hypothetical protein
LLKVITVRFKASFGKTTIAITAFVTIVLLAVLALIAFVIAPPFAIAQILTFASIFVFFAALYLVSWLLSPQEYILTNETLVVKRRWKTITINFSDITDTFFVRKESMSSMEKLWANAGFFGFYGDFDTAFGVVTFYATRLENFLMIVTQAGQKIVITPDDKEIMIKLKERVDKIRGITTD